MHKNINMASWFKENILNSTKTVPLCSRGSFRPSRTEDNKKQHYFTVPPHCAAGISQHLNNMTFCDIFPFLFSHKTKKQNKNKSTLNAWDICGSSLAIFHVPEKCHRKLILALSLVQKKDYKTYKNLTKYFRAVSKISIQRNKAVLKHLNK